MNSDYVDAIRNVLSNPIAVTIYVIENTIK